MRQRLGPKLIKQIENFIGLPVEKVLVRGNTGHRRDVFLKGGGIYHMWPNGVMSFDGFDDIGH